MNVRVVLIIVALLFITVAASRAETSDEDEKTELKKSYLYRWTDKKGAVHITDGLGKVPEQYRQKARKVEAGKTDTETESSQASDENSPAEREDDVEPLDEAAAKDEWQRQIRDWKARKESAERRYRDLDAQWKALYGKWGGAVYAPPDTKLQVEQIQQEMAKVKEEADEARSMLEVVLPEKARKAGVPPGWLR